MRYLNWDVLLFPEGSKIPIQEFKTDCHVVSDEEPGHFQQPPFLIPVVTTFVPALPTDFFFRVSIHCWMNPEPSRFTKSLTKYSDDVLFEARLLIDGVHSGSKVFDRTGPWPAVIDSSIELDKNGGTLALKFPPFHRELTTRNFWEAGENYGRIKVTISECFPRESISLPLHRIRNLVCFSFQHAPLETLENAALAWPNASMWNQAPVFATYSPRHKSPSGSREDAGPHSHSPRRRPTSSSSSGAAAVAYKVKGSTGRSKMLPRDATDLDPFTDHHLGSRRLRQISSSDTSMPDYSSGGSFHDGRQTSDPLLMTNRRRERRYEAHHDAGVFSLVGEACPPSVPANTPQTITVESSLEHSFIENHVEDQQVTERLSKDEQDAPLSQHSTTSSAVRSRKDASKGSPKSDSDAFEVEKTTAELKQGDGTRKVAQLFASNSTPTNASFRQNSSHHFVPHASSNMNNCEGDLRGSPSLLRKTSGNEAPSSVTLRYASTGGTTQAGPQKYDQDDPVAFGIIPRESTRDTLDFVDGGNKENTDRPLVI